MVCDAILRTRDLLSLGLILIVLGLFVGFPYIFLAGVACAILHHYKRRAEDWDK
jgi:hypothetical protein